MNRSGLNKLICTVAALFVTLANAQPPSDRLPIQNLPEPLRDTLKDIPAAGATCNKENLVVRPATRKSNPSIKPVPECATTMTQLSNALTNPNLVLVDTRTKTEFDRFHIDGAVNFSVSEVRTKRFLSDKFVVLIGDGKADQDLYELCSELKSAGFKKTQVLRGGMLSWLLDSREVLGNAPRLAEAAVLSSSDLFRESKKADNLLINLTTAHQLAEMLSATTISGSDSNQEIKAFVQKYKKGKAINNIVLVADERFRKNQFEDLAKSLKPDLVLIYDGSESSYRQFLRLQKTMWDKQEKGPTRLPCGF